MVKKPKLPKGAQRPREAVLKMAPYSPPTAGRADKLRLDFNENTVGCSPRVIEFLRDSLDASKLAVYPEYGEAKAAIAEFFRVSPDEFVFTNGTDEAIQVFINTYVDDDDEVLLLHPAYAMYRFYAEVAGAKIREIPYSRPTLDFPLNELLDAITPQTRAILIANPNNPTGTGVSLLAIERILKRARKAVVFIDEAYYEFSGVTALPLLNHSPNLFVSRTFSKVYGMAAMRLGCLFSHQANVAYLHKAQSPYSVNSLAVLAAQEAVRDTVYIQNYVAEVLASRELLIVGLEKLGIAHYPSSANFLLLDAGKRAIEIRDYLRAAKHPRARPQLRNSRLRSRHRGHPRADPPPAGRSGRDLVMAQPVLIFDMDGVLVDVTDSYRETICQTVHHFTGRQISRAEIQDYKNQGGWNDDWRLSHHIISGCGVETPFETVVDYFQSLFHGNGQDGLILRERWLASDGLFDRLSRACRMAVLTGRTSWEAALTLRRFQADPFFDPVVGSDCGLPLKPAPEGLLHILRQSRCEKAWYVGDTVDDARCARAAGVPFIGIAAPSSPRYADLLKLFQAENAIAILDDINQLEPVLAQ